MDFNRRGPARPTNNPVAPGSSPVAPEAATGALSPKPAGGVPVDFKRSKLYRWSFVALLISATVLFIAMIFFIVFGRPINHEARYVVKNQYQAVFVNVNGTNGGQVYFGHIAALTSQYIRLTNVFYIQNQQSQDSQSASNSSYNLVKLGCELHGPQDEMIINRNEVFFWENLKSDSQVAQKAAEFYKQNPNGQKCTANSGSTEQSNTNTQAPATGTSTTGSGSTTTTPSTTTTTPTTTTKKP